MNNKITAKRFCDAFRDQWNVKKKESADCILSAYKNDGTWTEFMLGTKETYEGSFLHQVSEQLPYLQMMTNMYTLDIVYYRKEPNLYSPGTYPACLDAIIEHENQDKVEQEMWKLLIFRSPLKILIFYDYHEDEKKQSEKKQIWLQNKLVKLFDMGKEVDARCREAENAEYLFVIGNRDTKWQLPKWRYLTVNAGHFGKVDELILHPLI